MRNYIYIFCIIFLLFAENATAKEPYSKTSDLMCDGTKIQVITDCFTGNDLPRPYRPYPYCTSQRILFQNAKTGEIIENSTSGKLSKDKSLDALATGILCANGAKGPYLIINYYSGGNCEECEWDEILTISGKKLASSRHGKYYPQGNYNEYLRKYKSLGLPKRIDRSAFVEIKVYPDRKKKVSSRRSD